MKQIIHLSAVLALLIGFATSTQANDFFRTRKSLTRPKQFTSCVGKLNLHQDTPDAELKTGEFGVRYMPTFFVLDIRSSTGETIEGAVAYSHGFGVMFGSYHNPHIGWQLEINYYNINQKYRDRDLERQVSISYINIPLLLSLNTNKAGPFNLNFVAGPQFGLNVGSHLTTTSNGGTDTLNAVVAVKRGDVGLAYGVGAEFMMNEEHTIRFDFGYRGYYGLVNMDAQVVGDNTYNIIVSASRKTNSAYVGLTLLF